MIEVASGDEENRTGNGAGTPNQNSLASSALGLLFPGSLNQLACPALGKLGLPGGESHGGFILSQGDSDTNGAL